MQNILELIIKKKLEPDNITIKKKKKELKLNNIIKELLIIKNKFIILLYEKKLELYKTTLQRFMEIIPFSQQSPAIIKDILEIETKQNLINFIITTDANEIYFCEIKNKIFNIVQKMQGNILCKLNDNKLIKFFHINSNKHSFSIYKKGSNSKYDKVKDNEIEFKSYFEVYNKGKVFNMNNDPLFIIDNIRTNIRDYFDVNFSDLQMKGQKADIEIIKLLKLGEDRIIIITKEENIQSWGYSTDEETSDKDCKYVVFSIIIFDIKTGEKSVLCTRDYFFEFLGLYHYILKTFVHSIDANLIGDNYIYFNICFHKEDYNHLIKEFKNDFIICDIKKKSFVKHNLIFKDFNLNGLLMSNFNNILSYKKNTDFYLIFGLDLYEFKVTKNGIEKKLITNFNENNNFIKSFKFQGNTFYILTNNYLYIFRLKN